MTRFSLLALLFSIGACCFNNSAYSCVVTLLNNGVGPILVLDHNNISNKKASAPSSLIIISKGTSRRIGKSDEHAHFTVFLKHPNNNTYVSTYEVKQNECGKDGNPRIKLSELSNKTGQTSLFTITETSGHHTSMVRELPTIKKADIYKQEPTAGCAACSM